MPPQRKMQYEASPGELYKGITAVSENFEGETKLVVERDPEFVLFCKKLYKQFPGLGKGAVYNEKHREAIDFLGWKLSAAECMAAIQGIVIAGAIPSIILLLILYVLGFGIQLDPRGEPIGGTFLTDAFDDLAMPIFFMIALVLVSGVGMIAFFIYNYPIAMADDERNRALTYVPEMVGYLIMSMKLVPNLEKAIEFSAKHGKGKVSDDFKRLIWDFQIGVYSSISEGLDMMALRWGKYSIELKEALMKIRASVMEPSEARRYQILDKTMMEVLDSVKEKMGDYARSLNQPSVMLFYIGVLLPLLLVIILPVGSAFIGKIPPGDKNSFGISFANPIILVAIYCFLIPAFAYTFAKGVVKKRPPTYEPPVINDNYSDLPKKWQMKMGGFWIDSRLIAIAILLIGVSGSFFLSTQGFPPKFLFGEQKEGYETTIFQLIPADKQYEEVYKEKGLEYFGKITFDIYVIQDVDITQGILYQKYLSADYTPSKAEDAVYMEKLKFDSKPANDPTKYVFIAGTMLTIVLAFCFMLYYMNIYKRNAQLIIIQMEDEFKESMYMIASRMGENKPVENALKQAKDYLPNLMVSKRIFGKTVENIELMGLPLESAIFDPVYGSMKGIPSKIINTAMRLLVDSVSLGVEVASRTLMSLSLQMENMDKVNKSLKEMVSDVTTTMQTMAVFIAPMVLGITTALQKVVMMTLSDVVSSPELQNSSASVSDIAGGGIGNMSNIFKVDLEVFRSFATPWMYMVIIGIYVALIVIILTYFTTKIKEDNDLLFKINLSKMLPIAMAVYLVTSIGANYVISMVMTPM